MVLSLILVVNFIATKTETTRMKDLTAKLDTMLAVMDQREEKLLVAMDQRDERVKLLEQSLNRITQLLDNHQSQAPDHSAELLASQLVTLREEQDLCSVHSAQMRAVHLDLPRFDGNDVLQWILQAEQFFEYFDISDPYKLKIDAIHFDGPVVPWYQMLRKTGSVNTWPQLIKAIESTYGPSIYEDPSYALFKLT